MNISALIYNPFQFGENWKELESFLKEILSLKCSGWHPVGVYDKQSVNQSVIKNISNSKHESTAHVTAHVKDLVLPRGGRA